MAEHSSQVPDGPTEIRAWEAMLVKLVEIGVTEGFLVEFHAQYETPLGQTTWDAQP